MLADLNNTTAEATLRIRRGVKILGVWVDHGARVVPFLRATGLLAQPLVFV